MCSLILPAIPPSDESGEELRKNVDIQRLILAQNS